MRTRFRSWWQQIKQHRLAIGVAAIVLVIAIALIIAGYWFDWTGFNGYNKVTITHTIAGTNAGTVIKTEEYQPGKALWDWLNLFGVLAIPAVVALGAAWYTAQQGKVSTRENTDNQRETALQKYIDKMSELLLEKQLHDSPEKEELRNIARVRTLTVLPRLDPGRKKSVLQFLHESGLIEKGKRIIDLSGADLWKADLKWIDLKNADLRGALCWQVNFSDADLTGVDFGGTQLREVDFNRANLTGADLRWVRFLDVAGNIDTTNNLIKKLEKQARSLQGATMPDGSTHA